MLCLTVLLSTQLWSINFTKLCCFIFTAGDTIKSSTVTIRYLYFTTNFISYFLYTDIFTVSNWMNMFSSPCINWIDKERMCSTLFSYILKWMWKFTVCNSFVWHAHALAFTSNCNKIDYIYNKQYNSSCFFDHFCKWHILFLP